MILALCHLKQKSPFLPHQLAGGRPGIQQQTDQLWRQPAQTVRALLKNKNEFVTREWREKPIEEYTSTIIASNL